MSKSRGTFIQAESYLKHLPADALRYYFASKLSNSIDDLDLNLDDFTQRVNSDLVNKFVNLASRSAGFINKVENTLLAPQLQDAALYQEFVDAGEAIADNFEKRRYNQAIRDIMALADKANQYIDAQKPWVLAKDPATRDQAHAIYSQGVQLFRVLVAYLKPVIPSLAKDAEAFLNAGELTWNSIKTPLLNHSVLTFKPLMTRIESTQIDAMIEDNKQALPAPTPVAETKPSHIAADPISPTIQIDDFGKLDLRVAKIIKAAAVEGADKLVQLTLDLGGETRNVFAGIKSAYQPQQLEGRLTVMVANLAPRKMRFGVSEGMVLAASGKDGSGIFILTPDQGAEPGMRVK
jgi:methionyl-tRNA synthetase